MDPGNILEEFCKRREKINIPFEPKTEQLQVALSVLAPQNVLRLLLTGYEKTFCAIVPAIVISDLDPITLAVSPVSSLIDDQISKRAKIECLSEMRQENISGNLVSLSPSL